MKRFFICIICCIVHVLSFAFSGNGAGTEKSPYLITSADELFEVRSNLSAYYRVENDIDLSVWIEENSPIYGWAPIGTSTSPFIGTFDGNGKKIINLTIYREQSDNVGLFGYTTGASIANVILVNPSIKGNRNVGIVLGNGSISESCGLKISNCHVIGGIAEGSVCVGGISGRLYALSNKMEISENHSSADIIGKSSVGGICGYAEIGGDLGVYIRDCYSLGSINGEYEVGGILGKSYRFLSGNYYVHNGDFVCERNYVGGNVSGSSKTCGVVGEQSGENLTTWNAIPGDYVLTSNVCVSDTVKGEYRIASRVSSSENYANINTVLLTQNGVPIEDNDFNGTSMSTRLLQKASTYQSLGWDFTDIWVDMSAYNEYPVHKNVSPAPTVDSFVAKSKGNIKGTAAFSKGTVYCIIDKTLYTSEIEGGKWEISLGSISNGKKAVISACETGKLPSSTVSTFAEEAIVEPTVVLGDSNSDGVVDAADVVGTINYILGKPSSSFNQQNADVNEDGQILVDDAVGTVNVIMNNQ